MFNRFETYIPTQFNLPKIDLGILAGVLDAKQKKYDAGLELSDQLGQNLIDALPQDRATANTILQNWEQQKSKIIDQYNGDYSAAYRDLGKLKQQVIKDMGPGGQANAIMTNKKAFTDWYTSMSKDKEVNPDTLNAAYNYYMNEYKGIGEKNPLTQSYNQLNPEQIIKSVHPDTIVLPAIKQLEADGYEIERDRIGGQWIMRHKRSGEVLTAEDVYNTAYRSLSLDPNYLSGLRQELKFRGIDLDAEMQLQALAQDYANTYAYSKIKTSRTYSPNEWSMAQYKADRDDARQNQMLDMQYGQQKVKLDYSQNLLGQDLSIDQLRYGNKKSLGDIFTGMFTDPIGTILTGPSLPVGTPGVIYDWAKELKEREKQNKQGKSFIEEKIKDGSFEREGGNITLMNKVISFSKEGTSASQLLEEYNRQKKLIGQAISPAANKFGPESAKQIADEFLRGTTGQFTTITSNGEGITYQDFLDKYGKDIYDDKGNVKEKYSQLAIMSDGSDGSVPGFKFKAENGDLISFEAPPAYVQAKRPVMELTQAYTNPNGVGYTQGLGNKLAIPYYNPKTGKPELQSWDGVPMKMEVSYEKNQYGNYEPIRKLYEKEFTEKHPEGRWVPAKFKYNDNKGNIHEAELTIDHINEFIDQQAVEANFNIRTDSGDKTYEQNPYGHKIRTR